MVNLNKKLVFLASVIVLSSAIVVKAEENELLLVMFETCKKEVSAVVSNIDTKGLQDKAQNFFVKNPMFSVASGAFFLGKGWVNYEKSNNAAKYINNHYYPMLTWSKESVNQIEAGTQKAKDIAIRSWKRSGRINTAVGLVLLGGYTFCNPVKQNEDSVVDKQ